VHAVADTAAGPPGAGYLATQAVNAYLRHRLQLKVVPSSSLGLAPTPVAAAEANRLGARAVVMVRLLRAAYFPMGGVMGARASLEINVVRDGRLALSRVAESPFAGPATARDGRPIDPVYMAVSHALELMREELTRTFAPIL
jgi:hypothetical protein